MNEQTLNVKFVQEVEKHPCLYDYTRTDYSQRDVTARAWRAVGKVFNLTATQSRDKWRNLRSVFVRHMKPIKGSSSKYRKPYYLTDVMQFTIPFIKKFINCAELQNLPQEEANEVIKQEVNDESNEEPYISIPDMSSPFDNMLSPTCPSPVPTTSSSNIHSNQRKRKASSTIDDNIIEYFKARKAKLDKITEDIEDPRRMFLLSLLPDIKAMSDSQTRTFKRKVLALVDEILEESTKPWATSERASNTSYV